MKRIQRWVLMGIVIGSVCISSSAWAGSCDTAGSLTQKLWKKYGSVASAAATASGPAGASAAQAAKIAAKMIKYYNKLTKDGWGKIGPRRLNFKGKSKGTVIGSSQRLWVSSRPARNAVHFKFKKTGGKSKATVKICTVDKNNKAKLVKTIRINKGPASNAKKRKYTIKSAKGKFLKVLVTGNSVTKKMKYRFTASDAPPPPPPPPPPLDTSSNPDPKVIFR
jgi:hypothetical protein